MKKTILIGMNNKFSAKVNRWLFSLTGLLFLFNAGYIFSKDTIDLFGLVLGILMIISGVYYTFYGLTAFSNSSKYALRVKLDDKIIEIKNSFYKSATRLEWANLQKIEFGPYEVNFHVDGTNQVFHYNSNADVSKEIKRSIREFAEPKNIEVVGG